MKITIVFLTLFISLSALADSSLIESKMNECRESGSFKFIVGCATQASKLADKQLNIKYKEIMSELNSTFDSDIKKEEFRNTQRKWVSFRDANCDFFSPKGESIKEKADRAYCLAEVTLNRVKEFEGVLSWPIGCNGCPF